MIDKINFSKIVKDHISTLKDYNLNRYSAGDFILFFFVPLALSGVLVYFNLALNNDIINVLVTSLSVFAALLFNLLLLIYDIIRKPENSNGNNGLKTEFLKQIYANISFCILISIITIILLIISFLNISQLKTVLNFLIYFFVSLFILTLFMILKRVHILLSKEFESNK